MNSKSFADTMLQHAQEEAKIIEDQREEVLRAFIAKWGFDPEEAMQIQSNQNGQRTWQIVHISKADVAKVRKTFLISRVSKEPLNLWQKFCVLLANGKWPKQDER